MPRGSRWAGRPGHEEGQRLGTIHSAHNEKGEKKRNSQERSIEKAGRPPQKQRIVEASIPRYLAYWE